MHFLATNQGHALFMNNPISHALRRPGDPAPVSLAYPSSHPGANSSLLSSAHTSLRCVRVCERDFVLVLSACEGWRLVLAQLAMGLVRPKMRALRIFAASVLEDARGSTLESEGTRWSVSTTSSGPVSEIEYGHVFQGLGDGALPSRRPRAASSAQGA
jgi:hypothetical protein